MALGVGKDSDFSIDDGGGTLRDIGSQVESASLSPSNDQQETTGMGGTDWRTYIAGLNAADVSLTCYYDSTPTTGTAGIFAGALGSVRTVQIRPLGTGAGLPQQSMEVLINSLNMPIERDGVNMIEMSGIVTGPVTETTQ